MFNITIAVVSTEIMTVNVFVCGDNYNYTKYDNLLEFFLFLNFIYFFIIIIVT